MVNSIEQEYGVHESSMEKTKDKIDPVKYIESTIIEVVKYHYSIP